MTAMATRPLVISNLLCFAVNKFSRVPNKPLKLAMLDFYTTDDICTAKKMLMNEVDKILLDKWAKPAKRRKDSVNRTNMEIDDIFNVIAAADGNKIIEKLPVFVSTDPDKMPSIKLTEGDLVAIMVKLFKIESKIDIQHDKIIN